MERFVRAHYIGQAVDQTWKYVLLEMLTSRTGRYTPRGNRVDVWLRHRTSDGNIAQETNVFHLYDPPADVAALLDRPNLRIVDLGGHVGLFAARMLTLYPHARVTSIEMDASNYTLLESAAATVANWQCEHAAAWTENDTVMYCSDYAESKVAFGFANVAAAIDVFPLLANADLIKIDIEGAEWRLLQDPRFADLSASVVALEWHPDNCPGSDPRDTALGILGRAGYAVREIPIPHAEFASGVGMAWAWRR